MINRTFHKLFALLMLVLPVSMSAYDASYYASSSRLSSGRWVKIKVSQTGIHQLSHETLRSLGFKNPEKVAVFGYGGARLTSNAFAADLPDDVTPTAVCHTADGRLLFYAEADLSVSATSLTTVDARRNVYGTDAYYFLTDSQTPEALPAALSQKPAGTPAENHLSVVYIENEAQNPADGGAIFHDTPFKPGDVVNYDFTITDFHADDRYPSGMFKYGFATYHYRPTSLDPLFPEGLIISNVINNPAPLETQQTKFYTISDGSATIDGVSSDGIYTIGFRLEQGAQPSYTAMDYAWLIYPRLNRLVSNTLVMNFPGMKANDCVSLKESDSSVLIWDISDAAAVRPCAVYYNGNSATAVCPKSDNATNTRRLMAFRTTATFPEAEVIGRIFNQNLHGEYIPEMVIITTDDFISQAERLANLHRSLDRLSVRVVTQQEIFNEFSSGTRSAMGYRRYLKMLYDREPTTIKYVLLYGHGTWDNRRKANREEILCYETEDVEHANDYTKNFASDKYFVMLENDFDASRLHFGIMSLAVGRIDVTTQAEAEKINAKIERFLKRGRGHDVYGNILVLSDDGDRQGHFLDAESIIREMTKYNRTLTYTRVHNLIYPWENRTAVAGRKAISHALRGGQGFFIYTGHCDHVSFTAERLYDINLISEAPCNDFPFAMLATCETFGFDRNSQVIGPSMLRSDNGGAIGVIGSCRSVYMGFNYTHAEAVARAYANANSNTTIGDIVRSAHNFCMRSYSEDDRAANALCYNLCGDPALKVGAPDNRIKIDKIDGTAIINENTQIELPALKTITIEGHIEGENATFDGSAIFRLYDVPYVVKTNDRSWGEQNQDKDLSYDVTIDEKILSSVCSEVEKGKFVAKITVPESTNEGICRLTISAISKNKKDGASYSQSIYKVTPYDGSGELDLTEPEITDMYIGSPAFTDGQITGSSVVLHADITVPPTGLDACAAFGSGVRLTLDNRTSYATVFNAITLNSDNTASLTYPLNDLTDGRHELTLSVSSATGATATKTIGFMVQNSDVACSLEADNEIARENITFALDHGFYTEPSGRIIIENAAGETVFSAEGCSFPYQWNLRDNSGAPVADGQYRAYSVLRDDINFSSTPAVQFTVIR